MFNPTQKLALDHLFCEHREGFIAGRQDEAHGAVPGLLPGSPGGHAGGTVDWGVTCILRISRELSSHKPKAVHTLKSELSGQWQKKFKTTAQECPVPKSRGRT